VNNGKALVIIKLASGRRRGAHVSRDDGLLFSRAAQCVRRNSFVP